MKAKKKSKMTYFISALLAVFLLVGTLATGVYAADGVSVNSGSKDVHIKCVMMTLSSTMFNYYDDTKANRWDMSYSTLNGSLAAKFNITDSYPDSLSFSSSVKTGTLSLQVVQGDKVVNVPVGEQTVSLDGFKDGSVTVRVVASNAHDGAINMKIE